MSLRLRVVISLACAVLVGVVFVVYADRVRAEVEEARSDAIARYGGEVVSVVVANRALERGEVVSAADVSERDWLVELVPEDVTTSMDDVVGRAVTVPVAKGAPLCALNFREEAGGLEVPEGQVAVSVPLTDRTGVPLDVSPGSVVIAYATGDEGTELLSEDVTVLELPEASSGLSASLTLATTPDAVPEILTASAEGTLRLVVPAEGVGASSAPAASPNVPPEGEE